MVLQQPPKSNARERSGDDEGCWNVGWWGKDEVVGGTYCASSSVDGVDRFDAFLSAALDLTRIIVLIAVIMMLPSSLSLDGDIELEQSRKKGVQDAKAR